MDLYASLLAYRLFPPTNDLMRPIKFSTFGALAGAGTVPIPILTAVFHDNTGYHWFEFTPYDAGLSFNPARPASGRAGGRKRGRAGGNVGGREGTWAGGRACIRDARC